MGARVQVAPVVVRPITVFSYCYCVKLEKVATAHLEGRPAMPVARREAQVLWEGPLAGGAGTLTSGSGALDQLAVTWASRTERPDGRTSPEELIASAHASCFAMALALVLGDDGAPPERLEVSASCTLDEVDGAPRITSVELAIRARVPGLDPGTFDQLVGRAGDLCPVSNALVGNVEISVRHKLETG
jgi:osmotically inducible protein OsmC